MAASAIGSSRLHWMDIGGDTRNAASKVAPDLAGVPAEGHDKVDSAEQFGVDASRLALGSHWSHPGGGRSAGRRPPLGVACDVPQLRSLGYTRDATR